MRVTPSRVLKRLRSGDLVRVAGLSRVTDPWVAEVIGAIGYDVIWLDLEHRDFGIQVVDGISRACRLAGIDLMVRIEKSGYHSPMQALEFGANGLMIPHIRSVEEARQWVEWCRFPPMGKRGLDGAGADSHYGLDPILPYLEHANRETFLAFQVEDKEAVDQIDSIAAVPGYDLLFVGPGDLSLSYGVPMQFDHPLLEEAMVKVNEACKRYGKWWGTTSGSAAAAQRVVDLGATMFTAGGDHGALVEGFRQSFERNRVVIKQDAASKHADAFKEAGSYIRPY
jgi:4-hydroxy-2-oxoheptanedioate aldolase